jgi:hypothetical protein
MKLEFYNLRKQSPEVKFLTLIPTILFAKEIDDETEFGSVFFIFLFWGMGVNFKKRLVLTKYAMCRHGLGRFLTTGKEYEIIKSVGISYIVKRDDDSIDKVAKSRFYEPFEKQTV